MNGKGIWAASAAIAIGAALLTAGCSQGGDSGQAATGGNAGSAPPQTAGSKLGETVKDDGLSVTLNSDPAEPKMGKVALRAKVEKDGKPVDDATVRLTTRMPTMGHDGPGGEMARIEPGTYAGTVDFKMGGEVEATVSVSQGGLESRATYSFVVMQ